MYGYSDISTINQDANDGFLTDKVKNALLGVHERAGNVPIEPSEKDLEFLNGIYGQYMYIYVVS